MNRKLTVREIAALKDRGEYAIGGGLYLQISKWGTKSWVFRYSSGERTAKGNMKRRRMGLGSIDTVSLKQARDLAEKHRQTVRSGQEPIIKRNAEKQEAKKNQVWTFDRCAEAYISAHEPSWKNKKHAQQWRNTLAQYASPVFGRLPVEEINTPLIMSVIEPIWLTKNETASRVRGRIERVLSWAIVNGYRPHPNPALWRGNLMELLPARAKIAKPVHHPALPYQELGLFMQTLSEHSSLNAHAMKFTILTACRTNEVLAAAWNEIDLNAKTWTIPAERMKSERPHRVPLSTQAIATLEQLPRVDGWLFPSTQRGKHLSNMAMLNLLNRQLKRPDLTVHGFRSTFRDWVAEQTNYQRELAEAALAHVLGDKTEAAYQRGDMLEKRAELMQAWADYSEQKQENIISLTNQKQPNKI